MQEAQHEVAGLVADVAWHANGDLADLLEELFAVLFEGGLKKIEDQRKEKAKRLHRDIGMVLITSLKVNKLLK